ncbi:fucose 4-O-acetylase-like acetyltransferase [Chitinophaga skermanii]|uniref:Fucose 4-O-acetylase-like acetyltransferase n=1 Tax=Chitinophaga skermanii TaxID=331697 RepID=A0A327R3V0_9BACT|nr:acyltransferase family protein [Chitinophaga skermanii]RAJ08557.1 fucose 4-O-acetylase-like acetyltransferase [Chitinophaga skermanii]
MQRNLTIDAIKGFAILLVVLGHAIQYNMPGAFDQSILFRMIYSFHMPLFIFLSGYVSFGTFDGSWKKLQKRFGTLLVPFFAWFIVSYFFYFNTKASFLVELKRVIMEPDYGLWFLWVLFWLNVILFLAMRVTKKYEEWAMLGIFAIIYLGKSVLKTGAADFGLNLIVWYLLFFLTGYAAKKHHVLRAQAKPYAAILCGILYVVLFAYWDRLNAPIFITQLALPKVMTTAATLGYRFLVASTAIYVLYYIFAKLSIVERIQNVFVYFGTISLEIYATHFYFFSLIYLAQDIPNLPTRIAITFMGILAGTWVVQYLLKKIPVLPRLLYGKQAK